MSSTPASVWIFSGIAILGSSGQKTTQKQPKMTVSAGTKTFKNLKFENYISEINTT